MKARFAVEPILVRKAPAALAEQLREAILSGSLAEGTQLPAERLLAEQSQLSRGSVREALRLLEAEGLVVSRPGRNGGPIVQRPSGESVERPLVAFIRGRPIRIEDYVETRLAVEPAVARLAAANRTNDDIARLVEINDRIATASDRRDRLQGNVDWHVALAAASHNELLEAIMNALSIAIHMVTSDEAYDIPEVKDLTVVSHERILDAIKAQDADAAERRIRRHVLGSAAIGERAKAQG